MDLYFQCHYQFVHLLNYANTISCYNMQKGMIMKNINHNFDFIQFPKIYKKIKKNLKFCRFLLLVSCAVTMKLTGQN